MGLGNQQGMVAGSGTRAALKSHVTGGGAGDG
jgi:hypothetical protein